MYYMEPIRIGVGGPVGAGRTLLVEKLTRHLHDKSVWQL